MCHKNSISEVEWVAGKELAPGSDLYVDILFAEWGWGQEREASILFHSRSPERALMPDSRLFHTESMQNGEQSR